MAQERKILRLVEVIDDIIDEFEEVVVHHPAHLVRVIDEGAPLATLLDAVTTICLPIGQEVDARVCMTCDHFIGCRRNPDGSVTVDCWSHKRRKRLARGTEIVPVPLVKEVI